MENTDAQLPSTCSSANVSKKRDRSASDASLQTRKRARVEPEQVVFADPILDTTPRAPQLAWSRTRQALCDALPFFKAHKGGTHTKNRTAHGLLIGGFSEPRDLVDEDVIITTVGGGRVQNEDGKWIRDSKESHQLRYWMAALEQQQPIGVIIDKKHPAFGRIDLSLIDTADKTTINYIVLGCFFVSKVWQEHVHPEGINKPYTVSKLMLCKINSNGTRVLSKDLTIKDTQMQACPEVKCKTCQQKSPRIFKIDDFVCLNKKCVEFFRSGSAGEVLDAQALEYNEELFKCLQNYPGDLSKVPQVFQPVPQINEDGFGTEKALRGGMTCPLCGACSRRTTWAGWNCENCSFRAEAFPAPYPLDKVRQESAKKLSKMRPECFREDGVTLQIDESSVEKKQPRVEGGTTITEYIFRNRSNEAIGAFIHSRPNDALKAAPNGADNLFMEIQANDIGLTRYPSRCSGSAAEIMTRHFMGNWGFPYEFGVKVPTKPLQGAPEVVLKALSQLTYYGKQAVDCSQRTASNDEYASVDGSTLMDPWTPYNEELVLGYMEEDRISWHDDGEAQLSGTITTICLGSPAEMHLRMKDTSKTSLKVQLLHGDTVTMCDTQLQKFTDHRVIPQGVRRFAVTGRAINPEYYEEDKNRHKLRKLFDLTAEEAREAGKLPQEVAEFSYPGLSTSIDDHGEQ